MSVNERLTLNSNGEPVSVVAEIETREDADAAACKYPERMRDGRARAEEGDQAPAKREAEMDTFPATIE